MGRSIEFGQPSIADPGTALSIAEEVVKTGQGVDIWFQPIVELRTGKAIGYEALSVLVHRNTIIEGMGHFYRFLQEDEALCVGFEMLVMKLAVGRFAEACRSGDVERLGWVKPNLMLFVNVSPGTLLTGKPVAFLRKNRHIDIHRVVIEIIEHSMYNDKKGLGVYVHDIVTNSGSAGPLFALDDAFDGDSIKILGEIGTLDDLAFLKTNTHNEAYLELLKSVRKRTVFEGISDLAGARLAVKQGFILGQGWLFGKKSPRLASPLRGHHGDKKRREG